MYRSPALALVRTASALVLGMAVLASSASAQTYHFSTLAGSPSSGTADGVGGAARFSDPNGLVFDGTNLWVSDRLNHTIRRIAPGNVVTTIAGLAGTTGFVNGTGTAARFNRPGGIAIGSDNILYVADTSNHVIRKVTQAGVVTTLAGSGTSGAADGTGAAAQFASPNGIAVDGDLNVYVADSGNHTIRRITPAGVVTTLAGSPGLTGTADGTAGAARFNFPQGLVFDGSANLFATDSGTHIVRQITIAGGVVTTVAGGAGVSGTTNGTGTAARFNGLRGITRDGSGNLYVAEATNHTIRKIAPGFVVTKLSGTFGSSGNLNGTADTTLFNQPWGIAANAAGSTVYVSESFNNGIRSVTAAGVTSHVAGGVNGFNNGTGSGAGFSLPLGIAVNPTTGNVYVSIWINSVLRQITGRGVTTTFAGSGSAGTADGTGLAAQFGQMAQIATDSAGNIFVADRSNHTIRKVTPAGVVTTLAGSAGQAGNVDGTGAAARFTNPDGIEVAPDDTLYVSSNQTIRHVTQAGVVTTLAGTAGVAGNTDATGAAARFNTPTGLAVDNTFVYVTDTSNHTVRRITRAGGVVTTLAGSPGLSGSTDGTGNAARFTSPLDLALDSTGTLFVTDFSNNTIRRLTAAGVVTTEAGLAGARGSTSGSGSTARFNGPQNITIGKHDTIYITDRNNNVIRMGVKATTDVATNGSFASGTTGWLQFGLPTQAAMISNVTGGVFQFQRNGTQAVVFQETGLPVAANSPVQVQFQIGNSDPVRKRISVLFHDSDFADLSVCTFFLPPNAPLTTYTMRSRTTKAWGSATVSFYAATNGTGGFYRLDNVNVQYTPAFSATQTLCIDPTVPAAPGGAAGPNLLANGAFSSAINTGAEPRWNTFGQIASQVTGGVFQFRKLAGTPAGVLLQSTGQAMAANQIMTALFQLGNSSAQRQRATVIMHDQNFSDLSACTFWIEPNTPLRPYIYRSFATQGWANATFSVYPATTNGAEWLLLDDVSLQRTPAISIFGTQCTEPNATADVMGDAALSAPSLPFTVSFAPSTVDSRENAVTLDGDWLVDGFEAGDADGWQAVAAAGGRRILTLAEPFDLIGATTATLRLDSWLSGVSSRAFIEVSLDGDLWTPIHVVDPSDTWMPIERDLTAYAGTRLHVRFVFDAVAPHPGIPPDVWRIEGVVVEVD
jgi:hypothetical protein